ERSLSITNSRALELPATKIQVEDCMGHLCEADQASSICHDRDQLLDQDQRKGSAAAGVIGATN
ncbi:MAG TPA: hypothetical protein VFT63_00785, partial [bacterium]|nr:hypothetical protein [bacterium]